MQRYTFYSGRKCGKIGKKSLSVILPVMSLLPVFGCGHAVSESQKGEKEEAMNVPVMKMKKVGPGMAVGKTGLAVWTWIADNAEARLMPRTLFPRASDSLMRQLGLENGVPASVNVFLMEKDGKRILFDAGNGFPDSRLPKALDTLGMGKKTIDYVFLTHLHGDHIGGLLREGKAVFPQAQIYVCDREYAAWLEGPDAEKNGLQRQLADAYGKRLNRFSYGDTLPCGVVALDGRGHTPGHTVFLSDSVLIVGDLMHGMALQVLYPEFCATYDRDEKESVSTRIRIMDKVRQEGLTAFGMHLPEPGVLLLPEE